MKIVFVRQYRKRAEVENGVVIKPSKIIFVYGVENPEDHAKYLAIKGDKAAKDENGKPVALFFSPRYHGKEAALVLNKEKTDWLVDTTEADKLASLTAQYGIEVAREMMKPNKVEITE